MTEAGEGEDARIKSAIGIGSLLADGIGDTIRVSLTEDSIHEIPVAQALCRSDGRVDRTSETADTAANTGKTEKDPSFPSIHFRISDGRRKRLLSREGVRLGGEEMMRVVVRQANFEKIAHKIDRMGDYKPEIVYEKAGVVEVDPRDDEADCAR